VPVTERMVVSMKLISAYYLYEFRVVSIINIGTIATNPTSNMVGYASLATFRLGFPDLSDNVMLCEQAIC